MGTGKRNRTRKERNASRLSEQKGKASRPSSGALASTRGRKKYRRNKRARANRRRVAFRPAEKKGGGPRLYSKKLYLDPTSCRKHRPHQRSPGGEGEEKKRRRVGNARDNAGLEVKKGCAFCTEKKKLRSGVKPAENCAASTATEETGGRVR